MRNPTITAFEDSPDGGTGQARDMRVRWALEEVGQPYEVRLVSMQALKQPAHKAIQPFGQIPTYEDGEVALFESGAIVLHIGELHPGLLPPDAAARARAITWMFAALTTVEPPIVEREQAMLFEKKKSWYAEHLALIDERLRARLDDLSARLGSHEWLDGAFTAGDLLMVHALKRDGGAEIVARYGNLVAYLQRAEARPAYQRAYAAQAAVAQAKAKSKS